MNSKGVIVASAWTGCTVIAALFAWRGEFTASLLFILAAVFITFAVGFGMHGDVSPIELKGFRNLAKLEDEISMLREEVKAISEKIDEIKRLFEE